MHHHSCMWTVIRLNTASITGCRWMSDSTVTDWVTKRGTHSPTRFSASSEGSPSKSAGTVAGSSSVLKLSSLQQAGTGRGGHQCHLSASLHPSPTVLPPLPHSHTHTHIHTNTDAHTHTHTHTTHTSTHTRTHTHTLSLLCMHTLSLSHTLSFSLSLMYSHTHGLSLSLSHTHSLSLSRVLTLSLSLSLSHTHKFMLHFQAIPTNGE